MIKTWIIVTLLSAIFFAITDILSKKILSKKKDPSDIIFINYFIITIISIIFFIPKIDFSSISQLYILYLAKSISLGSAAYLYYLLLRKYELSLVTPLINLSPFVLLVFSSIFLSEKITSLQFLGIVILIISTYFLEVTISHHTKTNPHKHHFKEIIKHLNFKFFSLVSLMLITFSTTAILDKKILFQTNIYTNLFFTSIFLVVFLLLNYIYQKKLYLKIKLLFREPSLIYVSILNFFSVFFVLLAISNPLALISLIIPIRRTSTLFSSLFGGLIFHETHLQKKLFSTALMLVGLTLIVI